MGNFTEIALPAITPSQIKWGYQRFDTQFVSELNGSTQTVERGGRWTADCTWSDIVTSADAQLLQVFVVQMANKRNCVKMVDYSYVQQGSPTGSPKYYNTANMTWAASTPLGTNHCFLDPNGYVQVVTSAGTTGTSQPTWNTTVGGTTTDNAVTWKNLGLWSLKTPVIYGFTTNSVGNLLAGDYFNLATNELFQTASPSVDATVGGVALIQAAQAMRSEPAHTTPVTTSNPFCYMQMKTGGVSKDVSPPIKSSISSSFIEVIS